MTSDDLSSLSPRFVYSTQSGAIRCNQVQSDVIRGASWARSTCQSGAIKCNQMQSGPHRCTGYPVGIRTPSWGLCVGHVLNTFTRILKDKTRIRTYPRIRTPACVYAPPAYTHPCLRIRTYPRIRTLGCVYARTCVYAPTPAYKHVCVNAASGAYTHLPAYTHPTLRLRRDATNVMYIDFTLLSNT